MVLIFFLLCFVLAGGFHDSLNAEVSLVSLENERNGSIFVPSINGLIQISKGQFRKSECRQERKVNSHLVAVIVSFKCN